MTNTELTQAEFEKMPVYQGKYIHVTTVTQNTVSYEGQTYLTMSSVATGVQRLAADTVVANMVGFYSITEFNIVPNAEGWKTSDGKVTIVKDRVKGLIYMIPKNAKYRVAREATEVDGVYSPGTLAVRFADIQYPAV